VVVLLLPLLLPSGEAVEGGVEGGGGKSAAEATK
jgi:hypothetical protein